MQPGGNRHRAGSLGCRAVIFFEEVPTLNMIAGAVIVVGAGLYTVFHEYHLDKCSRRAAGEA